MVNAYEKHETLFQIMDSTNRNEARMVTTAG
jgi:hypothetical protein